MSWTARAKSNEPVRPQRPAWLAAVVIIGVTVLGTYSHWFLTHFAFYNTLHATRPWYWVELADKALIGLLVLAALVWLHGPRVERIVRALRLDAPILPAMLFAGVCVIPMAIGFAATRSFSPGGAVLALIFMDVLAPFTEEVHVRGFGFWQLRDGLGWPFVLAMLPQAVLTGLGHVDKGADFMEIAGIFLLTFSGGVLFSWLLDRWRSLWVPFFLHVAMNGVWDLYSISGTILGGWFPFAIQQVTVLLAVAITLWFQFRHKLPAQRIDAKTS